MKVQSPAWPPPELSGLDRRLWVEVTQWGLGAHERFLAEGSEEWLQAAQHAGEYLVAEQEPRSGSWLHSRPYPHTFRLDPPWPSAMAQGQAASLLVRLAARTGDGRYAAAARRALEPFGQEVGEGGVRAWLDGRPVYEEYPTQPPSFVLNGAIYALWGLIDVGVALDDAEARAMGEEAVDALAASLRRWDTGWWSRYDLHPHRLPNLASAAYHELHIDQLRALAQISPRSELDAVRERFERYGRSAPRRMGAFAAKVAFRLAVPRRSA